MTAPFSRNAASLTALPNSMSTEQYVISALGALMYAFLVAGGGLGFSESYFGQLIYNEYFLAIADGHMDLPARILNLEGHYTADGTAYTYHGVAPLLTRFLFGWFLPLDTSLLSQITIWIWAVAGTLIYQACFLRIADCANISGRQDRQNLKSILSLGIWFSSPGLLVVGAPAFYSEPVAIGYAAAAALLYLTILITYDLIPVRTALPFIAAGAALALHARPNLAVGLYAFAGLIALMSFVQNPRRSLFSCILAVLILGLSGLGFLALNAAKFGSATSVHGTFDSGTIQYGFVYWGVEPENSPRAQAFIEHGKFNLARLPHNLFLYTLGVPTLGGLMSSIGTAFQNTATVWTAANLGHITVGQPNIGIAYLWPAWFLLAAFGFIRRKQTSKWMVAYIAGSGAAAALTLVYGTVSLRYVIDMWPFVSGLAAFGLTVFLQKNSASAPAHLSFRFLKLAVYAGIFISVPSAFLLQKTYNLPGDESVFVWTKEECLLRAGAKGFDVTDQIRICRDPRGGL